MKKEPETNKPTRIITKKWGYWTLAAVVAVIILTLIAMSAQRATVRQKAQDRRESIARQASINKAREAKLAASLSSHGKKVMKTYDLSATQVVKAEKVQLSAIGDSVMVDIQPELQDVFKQATIDGKVARQFTELPDILQSDVSQGKLADNVLINLGTNGPMTKSQINDVLKVIGDKRQIFWVNSHVPTQPWEKKVNQMIADTAKAHSNVHVIDWHSLSKGKDKQWFADDDIHPNPKGTTPYVSEVAKVITQYAK